DFRLREGAHLALGGNRQGRARAHLVHAAEEGVRIGPVDRHDRLVERHAGGAVLLGDPGERVAAADFDAGGPRSDGCRGGRRGRPRDRGRSRRGRSGRLRGGGAGPQAGGRTRLCGGQRRRGGREGRRGRRGGNTRGDRRGRARAAVHRIGSPDLHPGGVEQEGVLPGELAGGPVQLHQEVDERFV